MAKAWRKKGKEEKQLFEGPRGEKGKCGQRQILRGGGGRF